MAKLSNKTKIVALSAVVASTGVIAYASNEASKKDAEQNVDTANLIVEKISKNRVKISVDNVGESAKAFQLSLKIDGNVKFNEDNINWLVSKKKSKAVETDYLLSKDKKEIDIFVASDSELDRQGSLLEVCEIDLDNAGIKSDSSYKIVPNMDNDKIAYKSIDVNNNQVEVANMTYDDTNVLSMNTPPKIALKSLENSETDIDDNIDNGFTVGDNIDNDFTVDVNDDVEIDTKNNVIKIKEGYDFNKNAKLFVEVSDEEDKNIGEDNITVEIIEATDDNKGNKPPKEIDIDTSKSGSYNLKYKVTDSSNESAELNVILVIEPEVWKDEPTISGVPKDKVEIYTGQIFDPNMPDGENKITAVDAKGNALEIDIDYSDDFNIDEAGDYTITYTAKDRFNNKKSETMTLKVIKDEAPEITGIEDKTINKGDSFDEMEGVKATGNGDDLTSQITISGKVNTNIAKEYPLTYRVSNERKTTTKTRKITVNGAPTITGDLSDITIKNGTNLTEEDILGRINISDDIDKAPKVGVDLSNVNTSVDGKYKAIVTAEDSRGLTTKAQINVIVSSKTIVDLDGSGDGTTESTSIKKKVVDKSAIDEINDKLNSLMDKYDVKVNQSTLSDEVIYKIKVSSKPMAFMGIEEEFFVDITVPKAINDETGGIIEPDSNYKKVSSITINGYNKPLKVGESITLTTTINPSDAKYKDLAWQYRKDKIELRHHDNGSVTITALEEGLSTVRALATDGSEVYEEVLIQVGSNTQIDEEAPVIIYDGKTDIKIVNGMDFKIPNVIATDNVDTYTKVEATIFDPNGKEIDKIDTTKAGIYKIKYTTRDKAGNEAELIINVTVGEPICGIDVEAGDAISEDTALKLESKTVDSLNNILDLIKEDKFDVNVIGKPEIDNDKAIYTVKLVKKQGLIAKLFKLNKNVETYYLKITVENKKEFTDILDQFNTGGPVTPPTTQPTPPVPPTTPKPPTSSPSVPSTSVTRLIGERRADTAAKISKEGWTTSTNVILVNGDNKHLVDGLTASPLASAKDAPILLSNNDRLPQETIDEIKRLKASNVIVVGGESAVPQSVIEQVKAIGNIKVQRIDGLNRYETSLSIAKEIDKTKDITKVFIGAGDGEADSLSISSVAGKDISPIILSNKDGLDKNTIDYLKGEKLTDAYFIGGDSKLSDNIISQVNAITSNDVSKNRIAGERRQDTNAKVIEKFYPSTQLKGIVVAKDLELVDALTVGPLATKKDIPVVIATDNLSKAQEDVLTKKKSPKIYEVGGGIKSSVVDKLKELLNNKK